jgi:glycosyltransferase involved in cell wall biosynthesis
VKIVMLCDFYNESLSFQENLMARYYSKLGHQVTVITSTFSSIFDFINHSYDSKVPARTYETPDAKIIRLPYRLALHNWFRRFPALDGTFESEKPDLIFVHNLLLNITDAVRYRRRHRHVRLVMDYHGDYSNSARNWASLKILHGVFRKLVLKRALPEIQRIFPVTPATAQFLREVYAVPDEKMEVMPLGADLDSAEQTRRTRAGSALRRGYGIPDEARVIFTGGKLAPQKRTEVLVEAFKKLDRNDVWLVVAGDSAEADADYKAALLKAAHGEKQILFVGWLDSAQMLTHLDMADIAAFPASQSIVWQQAIGMGKPLVIGEPMARRNGRQDFTYLNCHDNVEIIDQPEASATWLASTLARLLDDPARLKRMSDGALRTASEMLDWNNILKRTLAN